MKTGSNNNFENEFEFVADLTNKYSSLSDRIDAKRKIVHEYYNCASINKPSTVGKNQLDSNRIPKKYFVQAFINNISAPDTLEELSQCFIGGNNAQRLLQDKDKTNWTVPRWAKTGDIVFFMHSKTSNAKLTRMRTELKSRNDFSIKEKQILFDEISSQLAFHKQYGGKIYAIGRVNGIPTLENIDPLLHYKSRVFCDIDCLFFLNNPIDISEFNSFIQISRMSECTPVYNDDFDHLKEIIIQKNNVPNYFLNSYSTPIPYSKITSENWLDANKFFYRNFKLEYAFRKSYVDHFLKTLGDQKTIYAECSCYKNKRPTTFVDNVIKFDGRWLPVEVKINIKTEKDLPRQCRQYCHLQHLTLQKKPLKDANLADVINNHVLIIDTFGVYMYSNYSRKITPILDLDEIKQLSDIINFRDVLKKALTL